MAFVYTYEMFMLTLLFILTFICLIYDVKWFRIPNSTVIFGCCLALVLSIVMSTYQGTARPFWSVAGGFVVFALYGFLLYYFRVWGMGDAKLLAMTGMYVGVFSWREYMVPFLICFVVLVLCYRISGLILKKSSSIKKLGSLVEEGDVLKKSVDVGEGQKVGIKLKKLDVDEVLIIREAYRRNILTYVYVAKPIPATIAFIAGIFIYGLMIII